MLYPDFSNAPDECINHKAQNELPCSLALFRTKSIRGWEFQWPIQTYLHQGMKDWVACLLSRPNIEQLIQETNGNTLSSHHDEIRDIHKAQVLQLLIGPDGRPFMTCEKGTLWLVFSLSVDGFNTFGKKMGGGPASVTAIYMACLSLPIEECFKCENMYLVGVIPSPHKPSEDEINHVLRPLVDDLLE
ncbi:hypothetical protein PISMIDRAFT_91594 [Pisolithus microcarpus 441]|uniref:Uncharacterized protein n=1 Tax=Pisolithus microcarpus 441 TaxID=765257 RepID=A0A0C9ZPY3_9AGAM|nr:hypothetical protein PISMIDRAFT_91594 [Pisolithus microcarpus 441]